MSAACLTMFGFVPQILKILKTKSARDVSIVTVLQFTGGVILWMAYGVHKDDYIIIFANAVSLLTLIILVFLYFHYGREGVKACQ